MSRPGPIVLFGSGESGPQGRRVYERLFAHLDTPPRIAILETPAGFEPNSAQVAARWARYFKKRLQNFNPQVTIVPARARGTLLSPNDAALVAPLAEANVLVAGPGSPTYAVRQLQGSLAWQTLLARHSEGAALVLSSAMLLAASAYTLPIYEIYKVGEPLHWQAGLDLLGRYGLRLVMVPHWNNQDGGKRLDTRHCYMGAARFTRLEALLPTDCTLLGLDEHTALFMEPAEGQGEVLGAGELTVRQGGNEQHVGVGQTVRLSEWGPFECPTAPLPLPQRVQAQLDEPAPPRLPPARVRHLLAARDAARAQQEWQRADELRTQILALGWQVIDTPEGSKLIHEGER